MTAVRHEPLVFRCKGDWLVGHITLPPIPSTRGIVIIVGGPQYRVGSHRQFALLARDLAAQGIPVMRFDCRGMGDSTGQKRSFEDMDADVRAAIDACCEAARIGEVVIWGLCDAATAASFYAHRDPRVCGLVLLNPWVRTAQTEALTQLKHYYVDRLREASTWRRLLSGDIALASSAKALARSMHTALTAYPDDAPSVGVQQSPKPLPERMVDALERYAGRVLLILSGNDLIAREFVDVCNRSNRWRALLGAPRVTRYDLPEATHTFSRRVWRDQVAAWTASWLRSW